MRTYMKRDRARGGYTRVRAASPNPSPQDNEDDEGDALTPEQLQAAQEARAKAQLEAGQA